MTAALLVALASLAAGPEVTVQTLAGETVGGELVSLAEDQVVLAAQQVQRELPTAELLALAPASPPSPLEARPAAWVKLVDGSLLVCADYRVERGVAQLTPLEGAEARIATRHVAWVRFKHQTDKLAEQWEELVRAERSGDVVVIRKDAALDYLEGVAGALDGETLQFQLDDETVPVRRSRLEGLIYFHPQQSELPDPLCRLTDARGGQYAVHRLALEGQDLHVTTAAGARLTVPWALVVRLDFSQGKVVYLSDLEPERVELARLASSPQQSEASRKLLEASLAPRKDQAFGGQPLSLGGTRYARGLAIRSRTTLTWRLPGQYSRLRAVVGIDDADKDHGQVRLSIQGDGRTLYDAAVMGGEPPAELNLDLAGVRRLTIVVDYGEQGDVGDFLDLCDARIVK